MPLNPVWCYKDLVCNFLINLVFSARNIGYVGVRSVMSSVFLVQCFVEIKP